MWIHRRRHSGCPNAWACPTGLSWLASKLRDWVVPRKSSWLDRLAMLCIISISCSTLPIATSSLTTSSLKLTLKARSLHCCRILDLLFGATPRTRIWQLIRARAPAEGTCLLNSTHLAKNPNPIKPANLTYFHFEWSYLPSYSANSLLSSPLNQISTSGCCIMGSSNSFGRDIEYRRRRGSRLGCRKILSSSSRICGCHLQNNGIILSRSDHQLGWNLASSD